MTRPDEPTGSMFFSKRYDEASVAFQRAKRPHEAAICDAYLLREKARSLSTTTGTHRENAFVKAAIAFTTCAQATPQKLEEERRAYYKNAGECFAEGRKLNDAGESYVNAGEYTLAAQTYRKGGHFDEMVEVLRQYEDSIESKAVCRLTQVAQMYYFKVSMGASGCKVC
jgi:hypothetical protein